MSLIAAVRLECGHRRYTTGDPEHPIEFDALRWCDECQQERRIVALGHA